MMAQHLDYLRLVYTVRFRVCVEGVMFPADGNGFCHDSADFFLFGIPCCICEVAQSADGGSPVLSGNTLQLNADEVGSHENLNAIDLLQSDGFQIHHLLKQVAHSYFSLIPGRISHEVSFS